MGKVEDTIVENKQSSPSSSSPLSPTDKITSNNNNNNNDNYNFLCGVVEGNQN